MTKLLYQAQDKVLETIFTRLAPELSGCRIILGGGTALARLYLHHRVSCDLDFFLSGSFDPVVLSRRLAMVGLPVDNIAVESGGTFAAQLHGSLTTSGGEKMKVSFVEDVFAGMFDTVSIDGVQTEVIDGLYHRKLRTISGTGTTLSSTGRVLGQGHRQTARDLYDLYVLDTKREPLDRFIARINRGGAAFPVDIFCQNLASVSWLDIIDECEMLELLPPFEKIAAMDLKRHFDDVLKRMLQCGKK